MIISSRTLLDIRVCFAVSKKALLTYIPPSLFNTYTHTEPSGYYRLNSKPIL